jgi:cell surface protein SprA
LRAHGLINFVLVTSATACLMGIVTKPARPVESDELDFIPSKYVFPPDTPETEDPEEADLLYKFKDNPGGSPLLQPKSKLYLEDPANVSTNVEYDPKSGNYNVKQKVGERDYRPETYMNLKEYQDYMFKKQMREYWRSRVAADELNEKPRQGMIPKLQVNSELFDRIFGGNTVDIKPTGTAELIFGLNRNKNLNPSIPQRQQKITNFDFNMRIQLNLIGKIGDKLKITTNYNTEASFDWENQVKVDYTGYEDEIIKKIEAGNVTLPLNSSLISGSQTLFGFKTELQFGKLRATTVFSQQKGKKQEINVQGGAQMQTFTVSADNYEQNRHFFLSHYFKDKYDTWMSTLPVINTPIVITKVEVYLLGINGSAEQTRNIVAFEDLGEGGSGIWEPLKTKVSDPNYAITDNYPDSLPRNDANKLYSIITNTISGILRDRKIDNVNTVLSSTVTASTDGGNYMDGSRDYNIVRNARRLNPTEFTYNSRTGYISLNQQLNNDQALAVSFQYQHNGQTYQVGEFSEQVSDNSKFLVCKLLKSTVVNVRQPMWKLMMKNVYPLGAYNLNPQDFKLDVFYNNIETGVDVPYLPAGPVNGIQLIRVLNCDNLSVNGDKRPDGIYDFINGYTISQQNGRAYFPTVEPFGRSLKKKFGSDSVLANKYIFNELYDSTKTAASFLQEKNRFRIKGTYRSSSGNEIALNALNIPQGAVIVTANGIALTENTDYTVDYTLGRVKIINEGIMNSGATIKVTLESNSLFSVQQKSLLGTRLDYKANRNLTLGSTFLRFSERPMTQKVTMGDEPVSNIVAGVDFNYKADVPFLTRLLDKLPLFSTKEMSSITTRGEFAKLFPGNAKAIKRNGGNSYIDDFEGSISLIDIKGSSSWYLASIPQQNKLFSESGQTNSILAGINRARLNWYNVDAMFTRNQGNTTPAHYDDKTFSNNMWRQVFETELFPGKTPPNGQQVVLPMLDIGFYPSERGPYNYDVKGTNLSAGIDANGFLKDPKSRWGGIMRRLETNDFQQANIEYIQFWMMDPYNEDYNSETYPAFSKDSLPQGDLYINLGNISEDIVKDDQMVYENGLPGVSENTKNLAITETNLANVPSVPPVINAFSQDNNDRPLQDVGYDGLTDEDERKRFADAVNDMNNGPYTEAAKLAFTNDPSTDRYHFFRGDDYDKNKANTLVRYSLYNNPEGNSPTEAQYNNLNPEGGNYPTAGNTGNQPSIEDVNRDNTLSTVENYYQYRVRISPKDISSTAVGTNFLVDAFTGTAEFTGISKTVKWYQFKIPISQFENTYGGIEGFNSIRFMRVYMKGFDRPVLLRLARFELVRSDWRRYQSDLREPGEYIAVDNNSTTFDVSAVSLQENSTKTPVNYVMPPEIEQQQNVQTTNLVLQNEQALQMRVCDLKDGDSRAIFKNVELDTRMFNNIKMNVHGEQLNDIPLRDGDVTLFFRVGTDYNSNYYEYAVPLKLTPPGVYDPNKADARRAVWPSEKEVNFKFSDISVVKDERNRKVGYYSNLNQLSTPYQKAFDGYTVTIVGNPNLATIKSIMVGVRNPKGEDAAPHCVEVWLNELRLTDFNNKGGWATTGQIQAKLADLGMVSLAGTYKTPFWGSVESKINDRSRETNRNWDVSTSVNAGKFFPTDWKVSLPVFYNFGRTIITPLFNPLDPDVKMEDVNSNPEINPTLKEEVKKQVEDHTERKGFNLTNVRIDGLKNPKAKPFPWDISNFSATYAYTEISKRSVNVEYNINRAYTGNLQYTYNIRNPLTIKPFSKSKALSNKWFTLIRDFNLQLMPNSFGASATLNRTYAVQRNRDITSFYNKVNDEFLNPTLVNKNFTMSRAYNFRWDLSKAVKFDYTANNEARILEPYGETNQTRESHKAIRDSVVNTFLYGRKLPGDTSQREGRFGENTQFRQQMNLNVDVPINKIPIFDFVKTTYRYGGTYTWLRRPFAATDSIGNTIQNTNTHNVTGNFNLTQLYNKVPYFKKLNSPQSKNASAAVGPKKPTDMKKGALKDTVPEKPDPLKDVLELLARMLMMVKNASITYQLTGGQALPNFKPSSQYGGMDFREKSAPGFLFTTGLKDNRIGQNSAANGWLARNESQTTPYTETFNETYSYRSSIEPHGSLKIDLLGNYTKSQQLTEYILYDKTEGRFRFHENPNMTGNFNISTFTFFRSLQDGADPVNSKLFNDFLLERQQVARELSAKSVDPNHKGLISTPGERAYYDGYSENQQDVLLGAFYRTYTGRDIKGYSTRNIFPKTPLPNWNVTWDGLGKLAPLKKKFRSVTLRHSYRSSYMINGFSNNILFNTNGAQVERMPVSVSSGTTTLEPNYVSYYQISSITMSERYEPLIKIDLQFAKPGWTANVETRRDKTSSLNLTGFQIIETKGQEYIVGIGYLYPKLRFKKLKIQGKVLESNLTVKVDVSFRKNITIIRQITDGYSTPTGGTNIVTMRSSADYQLTPNITIRLFYDWIRTTPQTSASFPTSNINAGFSLRINFQ